MGLMRFFRHENVLSSQVVEMPKVAGGRLSDNEAVYIEAVEYFMCPYSPALPLALLTGPIFFDVYECAEGQTISLTDTGRVNRTPVGSVAGDILAGLFGKDIILLVLRRASDEEYTMVNIAHVARHTLGPAKEIRGSQFNWLKRTVNCQEKIFDII
jgi:hypothetical protein